MASSSLQQMAPTLVSRSKTMINNDLKRILKEEGMPTSGVKAVLQTRVVDLIDGAVANNDHTLFNRLQHRVANNGASPPSNPTMSLPHLPAAKLAAPLNGHAMSNGYVQTHAGYRQPQQPAAPDSHFKLSPFYDIRQLVLHGVNLQTSPSHRATETKSLILDEGTCARLKEKPTFRLMLFSAIDQPLLPYTRVDIAFPSQIEVRLNGDEVKANFKGLKNKPGSTRPADITDLVRITPANYRNTIQITYALTQKKYNVFVFMVEKHSVETLSKRIGQRNVITKQSVLNEMRKKASDPDIVVESSVMSLKDPVSTLKMTIPCRSTICTHNRCFDAESFLQLQEQAPTWQCPICNKTISFEALAVDEYVQEILQQVSGGTDQVTIEPDGRWHNDSAVLASNNNGSCDDDDDDEYDSDGGLVEIPGYRVAAIKSEFIATPISLARTPPLPSREASSAPRTGSKRGSEVIDLTLSDDDEPVRPAKKVAYNTPTSLPDPSSRRYQMPNFGSSSVPMRPQAHSRHSQSSGVRMEPPAHQRHSYGSYQPPPPRQYPGQGSPSYPTYIDSSP